MRWLAETLKDDKTDRYSSKRLAMLIATVCLGASVIILSLAIYEGRAADVAIGAVAAALAGLGGYSYVHGVRASKIPDKEG